MTSTLVVAQTFFASLVALIHVYIFYMESLAWGKPKTNRAFRVTPEQAETNRSFAFNQGFYNLFLTLAIVGGFLCKAFAHEIEGQTLIDYACLSVVSAGTVLYLSSVGLRRPAIIQGLPALAYLLCRILTLVN